MLEIPPLNLLNAALIGVVHALKPCAHSWPMLVPFLKGPHRISRVALPFAAGIVVSSVAFGALSGVVVERLPSAWLHIFERIMGGVLLVLGIFLLLRPRLGHWGHVHGDCEPAHEPHCEHSAHDAKRYMRFGPWIGLFLLGAFNMAVPCMTTMAVVAIALSGGGTLASTLTFGTFGLTTGLTTLLFLGVLAKGLDTLRRLSGGKGEILLIRASALLLITLGVILAFHLHTHA